MTDAEVTDDEGAEEEVSDAAVMEGTAGAHLGGETLGAAVGQAATRVTTWVWASARRRRWPIVATAVTLVAGMGYTLIHTVMPPGHVWRESFWTVPSDLWGAYRSAHFIGWGAPGSIYAAGTSLVTFPGILWLLAPVAMVTGALGLTEGFPRTVPHPTAWLVLGPWEILLSSSALFASDALAQRLGLGRGKRVALCVAEAVILWNIDVVWGHPEDAVAMAFALYALHRALDGRWAAAGWLFGAAVVTQPLVLLVLPVLLALGDRSRWLGLAVRTVAPSVALLALPLATHFGPTVHAIVDQPNYPGVDHVTPWTALAPHISGSGRDVAVAAGPGRVVALALAVAVGVLAWRWRARPHLVVWVVAVCLALRCFTESVMDPYYVWPALAVGLVAAALEPGWRRLAVASTAAITITVCGDYRLGPWWSWWSIVDGGVLVVLAAGVGRGLATDRSSSSAGVPEMSTDPDVAPTISPA